MRIGIIARMDKTGLGTQTKHLVYMLKPTKVLVIDSSSFNNNEQFKNIFSGFNAYIVKGFPNNYQVKSFLNGIDVLLSCEIFYNPTFVSQAKSKGIKTFLQYNYEFLDYLVQPNIQKPTKFLSPSHWMLDEVKEKFQNVVYLPPPIDFRMFSNARESNFNRNGKRFLHIVGTPAIHDRNGTLDLIKSLKYTKANFELVIKSRPSFEIECTDPRVRFDFSIPEDEQELYNGFDAMILPRRYAGLCIPMIESLSSGLPVIMTDITPNNNVLPRKWLVKSKQIGTFKTRTMISYHSADHKALARKIDWLCSVDLNPEKAEAFDLSLKNYSPVELKEKYMEVFQS